MEHYTTQHTFRCINVLGNEKTGMTGMVTAPPLWTSATPGLSSGPGRSGAIIHLQFPQSKNKHYKTQTQHEQLQVTTI